MIHHAQFANLARTMLPKLGIIAGGGKLPLNIISECKRIKRPYFVIALKGHAAPETVIDTPHIWSRLGAAGKTVAMLHEQRVIELVMVGSVARPSLFQLCPDFWAIKFFARTGVGNKGDDRLLQALIKALESKEGFRIVGAHTILPSLLAPVGVYGDIKPSELEMRNIKIAWDAALLLGRRDIGQAVITRAGVVVAKESSRGTAAMIKDIIPASDSSRSGVLVKISKPGQEKRADLPTIGPDTIAQAANAGLAGIAIEAGNTLILDKSETINCANAANIFIIGKSNGDE